MQGEGCGPFKDAVGGGHSYPGMGRLSMSQVYNGDADGHRDRMSEACFPKQERREAENGIPRDSSFCRAEDGPQGQSWSPPQENGLQPSPDEQDPEKDKDDSLTLSRKKRGRRKLERPTKCELWFLFALYLRRRYSAPARTDADRRARPVDSCLAAATIGVEM